jgi:hypothetical protein
LPTWFVRLLQSCCSLVLLLQCRSRASLPITAALTRRTTLECCCWQRWPWARCTSSPRPSIWYAIRGRGFQLVELAEEWGVPDYVLLQDKPPAPFMSTKGVGKSGPNPAEAVTMYFPCLAWYCDISLVRRQVGRCHRPSGPLRPLGAATQRPALP